MGNGTERKTGLTQTQVPMTPLMLDVGVDTPT